MPSIGQISGKFILGTLKELTLMALKTDEERWEKKRGERALVCKNKDNK